MDLITVLILSCVLATDACAVGMSDGMHESKMPLKKICLIAFFFGFFQFLMPVIGYFITEAVAESFQETFKKFSAWLSFTVLAFLGGKMVFEFISCWRKNKGETAPQVCTTDGACTSLTAKSEPKPLSFIELVVQAIATSIDALAIGLTLYSAAVSEAGLALGVWGATGCIGIITFCLSVGAIYIGKFAGDKLAEKASLVGGIVLMGIGLKMLLEGIL